MNTIASVFADVLRRQRVSQEDLPTCRKCTAFVHVTDMGPMGYEGIHCAPRLCEDCWESEEANKRFRDDAKRFMDLTARLEVPCGFRPVWLHELTDTQDMAYWRQVYRQYLDGWSVHRPAGIGFTISSAKTGNGKTTAATAIATEVRFKHHGHVLFIKAEHFREAFSDSKRRNDVRSALAMADLFVMDDLGTEKLTSDGLTALSETFDYLYDRCKPFIVTKNEAGKALIESYSKVDRRATKLWARIADRWRERCTQVEYEGPSLRQNRRQA